MANPKKVKVTVFYIFSFGNHVYKVVMKADKKLPRFKAGQFLHLTLDDYDPTTGYWPESRVFSIASCSDDRKLVSIVYSVKGSYTAKMEEELRIGSQLWLKTPYGDFIIPNHIKEGETAVLIAGGTGISPFIPFLKNIPADVDVKLYYGLKHIDLMIFEDELNAVLQNSRFNLSLHLQSETKQISVDGNVISRKGILSISDILQDGIDIEKSKFFISGPPLMIELFRNQLRDFSVLEDKIIIDEWG